MKLPAWFTAHGNPMNALGKTPFSEFLSRWGRSVAQPRAILAVSAHWESLGTKVTSSARPETIHDFYGFPRELFTLRYPAPGSQVLATRVVELLAGAGIPASEDARRGLDHGAWAPLLFLFPDAEIPVVQVSLTRPSNLMEHVAVGRALSPLREEGVLIVGSGNLVHNLGEADLRDRDLPVDRWAEEFDEWVANRLGAWDVEALCRPWDGPHGRRAHPTLEHYAPLLVVAGAAGSEKPEISFPFATFEHANLSMRCVEFA
ncbi:MAG: 4,5-DOPA dioxygenase extradiol [Thermoanaerobaculia bacterium]|nr:4,5-DOPA dioxygenase extradiol [Thermoanaerobaculia bacterium]